MQTDSYNRELSDKIGSVELKMTEKLGEVLAEVKGLGVTIMQSVDSVKELRADVSLIKQMTVDATNSTRSAHKRLDEHAIDIKPLSEANLIKRVDTLESHFRWVTTTVVGAVILAVLGFIFVK